MPLFPQDRGPGPESSQEPEDVENDFADAVPTRADGFSADRLENTQDQARGDAAQKPPNGVPPPPLPPAATATILDQAIADAQSEDWKSRADELVAELDRETNREHAALLACELGELLERKLKDEGAAVKAHARALQLDPALRPNLWSIRRVFYRRGLWPNLLKLIDAETRFAGSDSERADLHVEKGHILEDRVGDRAAAKSAYDRAIALDSRHLPALLARERLAHLEQDDATLARIVRLLTDAVGSPARKVAYLLDLARLVARDKAAIPSALEILAEASAVGVGRREVLTERARLAEVLGSVDEVLAALEARVALARDEGASPREVLVLRKRQADVAEKAGDLERAWAYLEQAASLAPSDALVLSRMLELAEKLGRWDSLASLCAQLAEHEPDAEHALLLEVKRAFVLERAGKPEEALACLTELSARAPGHLAVSDACERSALARGDFETVVKLLVAQAEAARTGTILGGEADVPPSATWAAALLVAAGDVSSLRLGRNADARMYHGQALSLVPGYWPAVYALSALSQREGRLEDACALLELQLDAIGLSGPEADDALEELARLYEEQGKPEDALRAIERLNQKRPDDRSILFRLEELLRSLGRNEERVRLLEEIAASVQEPARKTHAFLEVARIYEDELHQPGRAIETTRKAVSCSPEETFAREELALLLFRKGEWEELARVLMETSDLVVDDAHPAFARARAGAAAVLAGKLGQEKEAAALYRSLVASDAGDSTWCRLEDALSDRDELADVLESESSLQGGTARGLLLMRLGELHESRGRVEDARGAFRRAAEEEGTRTHATWALIELAAKSGDGSALADALATLGVGKDPLAHEFLEESAFWSLAEPERAARTLAEVDGQGRPSVFLGRALVAARQASPKERVGALVALAENTRDKQLAGALLLRAAFLSAREVNGPQRARELVLRALERVPGNVAVVLAATDLGVDLPAAELADLFSRRAELADEPETLLDVLMLRARALEKAGALAKAGEVLAKVLQAEPDHPGALWSLRRVARRAGDLEVHARATARLAHGCADDAAAAAFFRDAAETWDRDLAQPAEAAPLYCTVLRHAPGDEKAFTRAKEIFAGKGDLKAVDVLLSHKIHAVPAGSAQVPLLLERAALRASRGLGGAAEEDLRAVLELEPTQLRALWRLAEHRMAAGDAIGCLELLARITCAEDDASARALALKRQAGLLRQAGDISGAVQKLEQALGQASDDLEARELLARLVLEQGNPGRAAREIECVAGGAVDPGTQVEKLLEAAGLYRRSGEPQLARHVLLKVRAIAPTQPDAIRDLVDLSDGPDREEACQGAAHDLATAISSDPGNLGLHGLLAQVAAAQGNATLEYLALGAAVALGGVDRGRHAELRSVHSGKPKPRERAMEDGHWRDLLELQGGMSPCGPGWALASEGIASMQVQEQEELGLAKRDLVPTRGIARDFPLVASMVSLVGLKELELYVSGTRTQLARAISLDPPRLLLSDDVARPKGPCERYMLARCVAEARLRSGLVLEGDSAELQMNLAAAWALAGGNPAQVPHLASVGASRALEERTRALGKAMSRKSKKQLPSLVSELLTPFDVAAWQLRVRLAACRAALLMSCDLAAALDVLVPLPSERATHPTGSDLLAWAVSERHLSMQSELGL
ncbi:MAG: hypothetical protein HY698_01800 [Deltaproteobacteria bacterium]|nr:hypothetical protein [Deltaproteobacteria bacterium]